MAMPGALAILVAAQESTYVAQFDAVSGWIIQETLEAQHLMGELEEPPPFLTKELKNQLSPLLLVPDYWISSATFSFASENAKLVETFLLRKLLAEVPGQPRVIQHFDFLFLDGGNNGENLCTYFFNEVRAYELLEQLENCGFRPTAISSPALLWKSRLKQHRPDFFTAANCLIDLTQSLAHLYFYDRGRFLFSRRIQLPQEDDRLESRILFLSYELNQSLRLVSQRAKTQVEGIFVHASSPGVARSLATELGQPVEDLSDIYACNEVPNANFQELGFIEAKDLSIGPNQWALLDRDYIASQQARPLQLVTGVAGLGFAVIMLFQAIFLGAWQLPPLPPGAMPPTQVQDRLNNYQNALNQLSDSRQRTSLQNNLASLSLSLPEGVELDKLYINRANNPKLSFKGSLESATVGKLTVAMGEFLLGLKQEFKGASNFALSDIQIDPLPPKKQNSARRFSIEVEITQP